MSRRWSAPLIVGAALVAGALVSAGCAASSVRVGSSSSPRAAPSTEPPPDLALVSCEGDGTHVQTPVVRPRADGVHFQVTNDLGTDASFSTKGSSGGGGGNGAPVGVSEPEGDGADGGWSIPPGEAQVRCLPTATDGGAPGWQPITVVDPDGLYVPDIIDCQGGGGVVGNFDYVPGAPGEVGDAIDVAKRHVDGVRQSDLVHLSGYPEENPTHVSVERDGRVVATVELVKADDGGWLVPEVSNCDLG